MYNTKVLYWNAGGLSPAKYSEFKTIRQDTDVFAISEAGAISDNLKKLTMNGYNLYALNRRRQVASRIIVGVKKEITIKYHIQYSMEVQDKLEAIELTLCKAKERFKVIAVYNPPHNVPPLDNIENRIDWNTIIVGDFNAPSIRWGYARTTQVRNSLEDFIDTNLIEYIPSDKPTFLSYKGNTSNPDLTLAHVNLVPAIQVLSLESPTEHGHRIIQISIKIIVGYTLTAQYSNREIDKIFK